MTVHAVAIVAIAAIGEKESSESKITVRTDMSVGQARVVTAKYMSTIETEDVVTITVA